MKVLRFNPLYVLLMVLMFVPIAQAQDNTKPNIVIIWGDDIGYWNISAYNQGMMGYQTPNIDRIAKEGRSSPMHMESRAVPQDALHSLLDRVHFVPALPRWDYRALTSGLRKRTRPSPSTSKPRVT